MQSPYLLVIPLEIRLIIYQYCLYEPDGYHYDYESGKFRTSNGALIDHSSLNRVCKQINQEVRFSALTINDLNFFPISGENVRKKACELRTFLSKMKYAERRTIICLVFPEISVYKTAEVDGEVNRIYPQLNQLLQFNHHGPSYNAWPEFIKATWGLHDGSLGEAPSLFRSYLAVLVLQLSRNPDFIKKLSMWDPWQSQDQEMQRRAPRERFPDEFLCDIRRFLSFDQSPQLQSTFEQYLQRSLSLQPWLIPSEKELKDFRLIEGGRPIRQFNDHLEGRFSAAAVATKFLQTLSDTGRFAVRNITLRETHSSAAHPECHGLGLIPFCRDNPRLKVTRRVSLWRTILLPASDEWFANREGLGDNGDITDTFCADVEISIQNRSPGQNWLSENLSPSPLAEHLATWIIEALSLSAAGMPDNSFKLVIDAESNQYEASRVFELTKLDTAWQQAWEQWVIARRIPCSSRMRRLHESFMYDGLPQAIEEIIQGRSSIICEFPVGKPLNPKPFMRDISEGSGWDEIERWRRYNEY